MTFPRNGINSETGLIFCVPHIGDKADSEYQKSKLRPYLADKYNCIAVGVNYFGIGNRPETGSFYNIDENFLYWISQIYGIAPEAYVINNWPDIDKLFSLLEKKGITYIAPSCCAMISIANDEYQSFGFLPAIDYLQVLGDILKRHVINKKRIIAFGSSYGGYLALLLGKFAPNTFSHIISNSGFLCSHMTYIVGKELGNRIRIKVKGDMVSIMETYEFRGTAKRHNVTFFAASNNPWTINDETSPYYFSDSHRAIRSLLRENHMVRSETEYHIFHSIEDLIAPIDHADKFVEILKSKAISAHYKRIGVEDIDGTIFKNLSHGMEASLRGIFDYAAKSNNKNLCKGNAVTDFDMGSVNIFDCNEKSYVFTFCNNYDIKAEIKNNVRIG